jgi:hypothetical protein
MTTQRWSSKGDAGLSEMRLDSVYRNHLRTASDIEVEEIGVSRQ